MKIRRRSALAGLLGTTSAFCVLAAAGAAAAQQPAPETTAPAPADEIALDEVVVTARKTGENLIKVPVAITALTGDNLTARGVANLNDLNAFVPGLRYQNSAANRNDRSFTSISMRGMYPGDSPNRQAATVFMDGIAISGGSIPGMTDIERVEVVNGPQSAYFGRSTFAGALNFITRAPGFTPRFNGSVSAASYETYEVQAGVEGPIFRDILAGRLSARHYETKGQYDNFGFGGNVGRRKTDSVALSLAFNPTDKLRMRGFATYWEDSDGPTAQSVFTQADYNCAANPAQPTRLNYVCGKIDSAPTQRMSQNIFAGDQAAPLLTNGRPVLGDDFIDHLGLERQQWLANLQFDYDLPAGHTLSGSVGVNRNKWAVLTDTYNRPLDGTGYSSTVYLPYDMKNYSGEIRVASSKESKLRYTFGANYFSEDIFFEGRAWRPSAATPNPPVTTLTQPTEYTARTTGIFGSLQYDIIDQLTLSLEARYQWDKIGQQIKTPTGADLDATFKSFAPRAILSWHVNSDVELYASIAKGNRPGSFNVFLTGASPFVLQQIQSSFDVPLEVPEEKLWMYEAGLKGQFFDRRLRVLSAVYMGKWRDRQINQNIPYFATPTSTSTSTATLALPGGKVDLWGVELQAAFKATNELTFEGTFNYAETDIKQTSCTECALIDGVVNPVGNRLPRYPAYSGTLSATYERPAFGEWNGFLRADYIYTGSIYETEANAAKTAPGNVVNLTLGVKNENIRAEIFGRNIFDDKTPTNILRNTDPRLGANTVVVTPPERATVGMRVALTY